MSSRGTGIAENVHSQRSLASRPGSPMDDRPVARGIRRRGHGRLRPRHRADLALQGAEIPRIRLHPARAGHTGPHAAAPVLLRPEPVRHQDRRVDRGGAGLHLVDERLPGRDLARLPPGRSRRAMGCGPIARAELSEDAGPGDHPAGGANGLAADGRVHGAGREGNLPGGPDRIHGTREGRHPDQHHHLRARAGLRDGGGHLFR